MNRRTALSIAGTLTVTAMMLTACTPTQPTPTKKPAASASATPTEEPLVTPTQTPVDAPKDEALAVAEANEAYAEYLDAWFTFLKEPELGPEYLEAFVWPESRMGTQLQDTYDKKIEQKRTVEGEPFEWRANQEMSYVAPVTNRETGEVNPLGAVNLYGCSDNSGVTFLIDGVENTKIPKGSSPFLVVMIYSPEDKGWFIQDNRQLSEGERAPQC